MPGTEEIAKEVADILIDQGLKYAGLATEVVPKAFKGVSAVASITLSQLLDEVKKNNGLRKLMGMEGEVSMAQMTEMVHRFSQNSSSVLVGDSDANDYDRLLKDQGVLYAKVDRMDDNCKMYVYLNKDQEKVENVTNILNARRGQVTELNARLYFNSLSPDKVHVVEGLSEVETELFRHYAREQGLLFTVIPRKDGNMVACGQEDVQKARRALLYTGWALTGANGARVREQVEHRLAGRSAINISAEEGEREMYIVSRSNPGNFVHITSEDYEVYKQSKQVGTTSRKDPDFYAKCLAACDGLQHPIVMSSEQFQAGITQEDLDRAHTIDMFPEYHDDLVEMEQANRLASLVSMKYNLDDEHNATWGLWDPSVSYSEFAAYEYISDEEEREARPFEFEHFKQAAFYSQQNHTAYDVDMEEKNVDYIIAKAEEKRRQQAGEQQPASQRSGPFWNFTQSNDDKEKQNR